jgi:hypothetical protein
MLHFSNPGDIIPHMGTINEHKILLGELGGKR